MKRTNTIGAAVFFVTFGSFVSLSLSLPALATGIMPNDPLFERQAYLQQINAPAAWRYTTGSDDVVVAVLDSGLDIDHPDLAQALWMNEQEIPGDGLDNDGNSYVDDINGWDFINDIPDPNPKFGGEFLVAGINHGTLLSGIIAGRGNNKLGITGIAWRARIMPLRVLNNKGGGDVFTVVKAINYAIAKKVRIINLSFIGIDDSSFLRAAVKRAVDAGVIVVAASGNDQSDEHGFNLSENPIYPACFNETLKGVISVGSTDPIGQKAQFSPYGHCIDVMAPGTDIFSTQMVQYERAGFDAFYGGGWSGTSLSTAMVSGALALMLSVNPKLTPTEVDDMLSKNCDSIDALNPSFAGKLGCGQLNVEKLVTAAIRSSAPSKNTKTKSAAIGIAQSDKKAVAQFFTGGGKRLAVADVLQAHSWQRGATSARMFVDLNNDGKNEIITAPVKGKGPLKIMSSAGAVLAEVFPYGKQYANGISMAVGDLNGNGQKEIVTVPRTRAPAHVMIFNGVGKKVGTFFASSKTARTGFTITIVP